MNHEVRCIEDVIRVCHEQGSYFFDKETMKFWNSRIESELYSNNCFVTSEDNYDRSKTLYTVRMYNPDYKSNGDLILTVGGFQQFDNLEDAKAFAESYGK